jgi:hypothetical protein
VRNKGSGRRHTALAHRLRVRGLALADQAAG